MSIGSAVRARRKNKGMTLADVADAMTKYDAGNLSRFERGEQGIESNKLEELAGVLETKVSELYRAAESHASRVSDSDSTYNAPTQPTSLNEREKQLVALYRRANTPTKLKIIGVVDILAMPASRTSENNAEDSQQNQTSD